MSQIKVSLNRAHIIAERLRKHASELKDDITLTHSFQKSKSQLPNFQQKLEVFAKETPAKINEWMRCNETIGNIRRAISIANSEFGINILLTEKNTVEQAIMFYEDMAVAKTAIPADVFSQTISQYDETSSSPLHTVMVQMISQESYNQLMANLKELKKQLVQIADGISDANTKTVELNIPTELESIALGL